MPPNSEDTNNHDGGDNPSPPPPPLQSYFQPPPPTAVTMAMAQPPLLPPVVVSGGVAYSTPTPYYPNYGYSTQNPPTNLWGAPVGFQQQQIPGHVVITNNNSGHDMNDNGSLVSGMTMPVYSGHPPAAVGMMMPVPVNVPAAQVISSQTVRFLMALDVTVYVFVFLSSISHQILISYCFLSFCVF